MEVAHEVKYGLECKSFHQLWQGNGGGTMERQKWGIAWQMTIYVAAVVFVAAVIFLVADYFSYRSMLERYVSKAGDAASEQAVGKMLRHTLVMRTAHMLLMVVAAAGTTWLVAKALVLWPLEVMFLHQYSASKGDLKAMPFPNVKNEFADLYEMFNRMIERLNEYREGVGAKRSVWQQTYDDLHEPIDKVIKLADATMALEGLSPDATRALSQIRREAVIGSGLITEMLREDKSTSESRDQDQEDS